MVDFKNRRKNYYINKKFQRDFILKFCILIVLGLLASGAIIYALANSTVTTTFENSRLVIKSTANYIMPIFLLSSVFVLIVTGIATIFITLFATHKIVGPLYRMEKDINEVTGGNLNVRFRLRAGDEAKSLALSIDNMVQVFKSRVVAIKNIVKEMETSGGSSPEIRDRLKKLKDEIDKFNT